MGVFTELESHPDHRAVIRLMKDYKYLLKFCPELNPEQLTLTYLITLSQKERKQRSEEQQHFFVNKPGAFCPFQISNIEIYQKSYTAA